MGINANDTDVFQLLQKLKESNGSYPADLLASRRQGYLKQVAEITSAGGLAAALKNAAKTAHGTGAGLSSTTSTLLETLLVVAIVAEAGAVTYFYRDRLVALYNKISGSPRVEQVAHPPVIPSVIPSAIADVNASVTPVFTVAGTVTATGTATPSAIPTQFVEESAAPSRTNDDGSVTASTQDSNPGSSQAVSTPNPDDSHHDNGNHYGQTPIPARTKETDTQNKSSRNH